MAHEARCHSTPSVALRHQLDECGVPRSVPGLFTRTLAIQELAGHRELGMTQRYMHLSPAALHSAIRLLDQSLAVQSPGDMLETGRVSEGKINS